jgi:hypothetical protein
LAIFKKEIIHVDVHIPLASPPVAVGVVPTFDVLTLSLALGKFPYQEFKHATTLVLFQDFSYGSDSLTPDIDLIVAPVWHSILFS